MYLSRGTYTIVYRHILIELQYQGLRYVNVGLSNQEQGQLQTLPVGSTATGNQRPIFKVELRKQQLKRKMTNIAEKSKVWRCFLRPGLPVPQLVNLCLIG